MKIKVGDYDVLNSGSVVGNKNEPIDFHIGGNAINIVRLLFEDDESIKKQAAQAKASDTEEKVIEITFINYNSSLGTGNINPIPIGDLNGRKLFLNYRIYAIKELGKEVHFTWLLGKEVDNG